MKTLLALGSVTSAIPMAYPWLPWTGCRDQLPQQYGVGLCQPPSILENELNYAANRKR
jgi:hypothetical protein